MAPLTPLPADDAADSSNSKPAKRPKLSDDNGDSSSGLIMQELSDEVERFATLLSNMID